MNFRVLLLSIFLIVVAGALVTHFREQSMTPSEKAKLDGPSDIPKVVKKGPLPKAVVVGSLTHNFGTMEIGNKGEHAFVIRNEGQGPLELVARKEDHSCQCTLGTLSKNGLQPGEETTITLNWEIKVPNPQFQHYAKVRTNDPENDSLTFRVQGLVGRRIVVKPTSEVLVGTLIEGRPNIKTFTIHSEVVDSFTLTKLEPSVPNFMEVTSRPLTAEEIDQINQPDPKAAEQREQMEKAAKSVKAERDQHAEHGDHTGHDHAAEKVAKDKERDDQDSLAGKTPVAKSGYEIQVSFLPGIPVGKFRELLTIQTDIKDASETRVVFDGNRSGPIQILATAGVGWSSEDSLVRLGRFPAKEGKKVRLLMFVKNADQDFKIEEAQIDPPVLKYELVKDTKFQAAGREKFDLYLEVPPSPTPISLGAQNRGHINLTTNHPEAKEIKLEVEMASFNE